MPTLVLDPAPSEFEALLERRRRMGGDRRDEVWDGVLHMNPVPAGPHSVLASRINALLEPVARAVGLTASLEFNLGEHGQQYRVPDLGVHRAPPTGVWIPTAVLVVEILSPHDETWQKLPYYAERAVEELVIIDPGERSVRWLGLTDGEYVDIQRSAALDLDVVDFAGRIDWPPVDEEP
jgi:Uma2 family endonuclease